MMRNNYDKNDIYILYSIYIYIFYVVVWYDDLIPFAYIGTGPAMYRGIPEMDGSTVMIP
jgi:hypothetical protein